jgi:hypothetical protein
MNPAADETIIGLNKLKIALLVLGSCAFVAAGVWFLYVDAATVRTARSYRFLGNNTSAVRAFGVLAVGFFGLCALYGARKIFDRRPGLVFNSAGIVDNASPVSPVFIPWSEVVGSGVLRIQDERLLVVVVADPQKYVGRGGALKRTLNKANHKMAGSPITISAHTLNVPFPELVSLFNRYLQKYGGSEAHPPELIDYSEEPGAGLGERLLNWSPVAVKGTLGSGGIGILVLSFSSLDMIFGLKPPLWVGFVASLLPAVIFFFAVPDVLSPRFVRPAQWFAVVWYLVSAALSISLAAYRGMAGIDVFLAGFILLGVWPCVLAVRGLRAAREA